MPAGDQQHQVGEGERVGEARGQRVAREVVDPDQRQPGARGQPLGEGHPGDDPPEEAGPGRDRHGVHPVEAEPGLAERRLGHGVEPLGMGAGGDLGDDAAEGRVQRVLGGHEVREDLGARRARGAESFRADRVLRRGPVVDRRRRWRARSIGIRPAPAGCLRTQGRPIREAHDGGEAHDGRGGVVAARLDPQDGDRAPSGEPARAAPVRSEVGCCRARHQAQVSARRPRGNGGWRRAGGGGWARSRRRRARPWCSSPRPEPDGAAFAEALRRAAPGPWVAVLAPLARIVPVAPPPLAEGAELILTSRNAVRALEASGALRGVAGRGTWCVGAATARAAREAGLAPVAGDPPGTADALVAWIASRRPAAPLVHLRGEPARGEVAARLRDAGFDASEAVIYRQEAVAPGPEMRAALAGEAGRAVIAPVFSPRGADLLSRAAGGVGAAGAPLRVVALSQTVAAALRLPGAAVEVCARPDADAMIAALRPPPPRGRRAGLRRAGRRARCQ